MAQLRLSAGTPWISYTRYEGVADDSEENRWMVGGKTHTAFYVSYDDLLKVNEELAKELIGEGTTIEYGFDENENAVGIWQSPGWGGGEEVYEKLEFEGKVYYRTFCGWVVE